MRTERQIEASRVNGAKSRGPVTPEGKRNSSANAIKHGLLAETVVLKGELEDRFLQVIAEIDQELQPETPIEHALVEKMAVSRWRQLRLWGMEKAAMEYQVRQQADSVGRGESNATRASLAFQTLGGDSRSLDLMIRYDALCDRQYLRAHRRFLDIRRHSGRNTSEPSEPVSESETTPVAPQPSDPEPFSSDSFFFDPPPPDQSAEPDENQPNEPNNPLKTLEPAAGNPTNPAARAYPPACKCRPQTMPAGIAHRGFHAIRPVPPTGHAAAHRLQLQLRKRPRSPSAR